MKKLLFFFIILLCTQGVYAQVKIGDNPTTINPNSVLELESSNRGLLLPRLALDSTSSFAPLAAHVAGMIVYNTAISGTGATAVTPGFYYNDGTQWVNASSDEIVTTLDSLGLGVYRYINEAGDSSFVYVLSDVINNYQTVFGDTNVANYLDSTSTQAVINNYQTIFGDTTISNYLDSLYGGTETITTLVNNGDSSFTYINEAGDSVTISLANNAWLTTGNAGTTPPTGVGSPVGSNNYWGTSDAKNLAVGTNGITRMIFDQRGNAYGGTNGSFVTPATANGGNNRNFIWGRSDSLVDPGGLGNSNANAIFGAFNKVVAGGSFFGSTNVVGGSSNTVAASASAVFGQNNIDSALFSFMAGGRNILTRNAGSSVIAGGGFTPGEGNYLSGAYAAVFGKTNKDSASYSFAAGQNNSIGPNGLGAVVFGDGNYVGAPNSIAVGSGNVLPNSNYGAAFGLNNFVRDGAAFGTNNNITGQYATGFGDGNTVSGQQAVAFGRSNTASGELTAAFGQGNTSAGQYSATFGRDNNAGGEINFLVGEQNTGTGYHNYAFGLGNNLSNTGAFAVGLSNIVSGQLASAIGANNNITGGLAIGFGQWNTVSGQTAVAFGSDNNVSGELAVAFGQSNQVSGYQAAAVGGNNTVSGYQAVAIGSGNTSAGQLSATLGLGNIENSYIGLAAGRYNAITTGTSNTSWVPTDPLVQVGIGADNANRANALTILKNGNIGTDLAIAPTERIDVGSGNVRIRDINTNTGNSTTDNIVVADNTGVLKTVAASTLNTEPFNVGSSTTKATTNTQSIYQSGRVGIDGANAGLFTAANPIAALDVRGAIRGGTPNLTATIGANSAAFGNDNTASGVNSFAGGSSALATGLNSFAFGNGTVASGIGAVAMGGQGTGFITYAVGDHSFAVGFANQANGPSSVALGRGSVASAQDAIAMGFGSHATGGQSIAMGNIALSSGNSATAIGRFATASSFVETVLGNGNAITTGTANTWVLTDALFQIGNQTLNVGAPRQNALTILKNGNIGTDLAIAPTERIDVGSGNVRIRDINTNTGLATDKIVVADINGVLKTISLDSLTSADTSASWKLVGNAGTNAGTNAPGSAVDGNFLGTTDANSLVLGVNNQKRIILDLDGNFIGNGSYAGGNTVVPSARGSFLWGDGNSITNSSNDGSAIFGRDNTDSTASGGRNFMTGSGNTMGQSSSRSFVTGMNNRSAGFADFVSGVGNQTQGFTGGGNLISGQGNILISAGGSPANVMGGRENTLVDASYIAMFGQNNRDSANHSFVAGENNTLASSATHAAVVGNSNTARGNASFAAGENNKVLGNHSMALGYNNTASGNNYSIALGYSNTVTGDAAAIGYQNNVAGNFAMAIGDGNQLPASAQYAIGIGRNNTSSGTYAMTLGQSNTASGQYAFAAGYGSQAIGTGSVAIAENGVSSGTYSMVVGVSDSASGSYSFALGFGNHSSGNYSLSVGSLNKASGMYALSVGNQNASTGDYSATLGEGTVAASNFELAAGRYNAFTTGTASLWVDTDALLQVGTGTDNANRANVLTVLKNGNTAVGTHTSTPNSTLEVNGTIATQLRIVTADDAFGATDYTILKTGGATATITLPPASSCPGRMYRLVEFAGDGNASTITISPAVQTYNGISQYTSTDFWEIHTNLTASGTNGTVHSVTFQSDGTNWYALGR